MAEPSEEERKVLNVKRILVHHSERRPETNDRLPIDLLVLEFLE
jgi:hypothetical protein